MLLLRSKQARNRICTPRRVWTAAASATYGTRTLRQRYTSAGNLTQPIQWSSECYDPETALVYYNYRYYNLQDGRWTRRDPIGVAGGVNVYVICNNNQNSFVDIYGLQTTSCDQVYTAVKLADCLQQKGIDTSKTTLGGTLTTDQGTLSVEKSYGNKSGWGKINCTPGKKGAGTKASASASNTTTNKNGSSLTAQLTGNTEGEGSASVGGKTEIGKGVIAQVQLEADQKGNVKGKLEVKSGGDKRSTSFTFGSDGELGLKIENGSLEVGLNYDPKKDANFSIEKNFKF